MTYESGGRGSKWKKKGEKKSCQFYAVLLLTLNTTSSPGPSEDTTRQRRESAARNCDCTGVQTRRRRREPVRRWSGGLRKRCRRRRRLLLLPALRRCPSLRRSATASWRAPPAGSWWCPASTALSRLASPAASEEVVQGGWIESFVRCPKSGGWNIRLLV